jgi:integrase
MNLTTQIARTLTLPAGKTDYLVFDDAVGGFGLRMQQGAKAVSRRWIYQYDIGPRMRRMTIGDAAVLPAADARRHAARLQAEVRLGGDPAAKKAQARETAATTMASVLETYLPIKRANLRPRSYTETERHLLVGFKRLHPRPVRQITTAMVSAAYEAMVVERGATTATNAWRALHAFFDWVLRQGLIDRNPAIGVERRKPRVRSRVLSADEIKTAWYATAGGSDHDKIIRILLLSGARASEIGHLRWSEILPDRIVLAPERTKSDRGRSIPLTPTMRTILDGHPRQPGRDYVFGRSADRPFSGWSAGKDALDERLGANFPAWVVHDLRRTVATHLGELGISPHIISGVLGHAVGSGVLVLDQRVDNPVTAKHYNWATLEEPIRNALLAWDAQVMGIVEGRVRDAQVISLKKS